MYSINWLRSQSGIVNYTIVIFADYVCLQVCFTQFQFFLFSVVTLVFIIYSIQILTSAELFCYRLNLLYYLPGMSIVIVVFII